MTQHLKDAIFALQSLKELSRVEQEHLANKIFGLVASAKTDQESLGSLWKGLTPSERAQEFSKWVNNKTDGPGLTLDQTHRDTIYE